MKANQSNQKPTITILENNPLETDLIELASRLGLPAREVLI